MKLYHGTKLSLLPKLTQGGIQPRAQSKGADNWKHTVTSNKDAVYLTTAYPGHFAAHASEEREPGLILEIDRDRLIPFKLAPDEDFMEQSSRNQGPTKDNPNLAPIDWSMKKRTLHYRKIARWNYHLTDVSLEKLGTATYYGTIPWSAVTQFVTVEWKKLHQMVYFNMVDSTVTPINHLILRDRHEALLRWMFGAEVTPDDLLGFTPNEESGASDSMKTFYSKRREMAKELLSERAGITLHANDIQQQNNQSQLLTG